MDAVKGHRRRALHGPTCSFRACCTPRSSAHPSRGRVTSLDLSLALALDGVRGGITSTTSRDHTRRRAALRPRDPLRQPTARRDLCRLARDRRAALNAWCGRWTSRSTAKPAAARLIETRNATPGPVSADVTITREYRTPVAPTPRSSCMARAPSGRADSSPSTNRRRASSTRAPTSPRHLICRSRTSARSAPLGGGFGAKNGASHAT